MTIFVENTTDMDFLRKLVKIIYNHDLSDQRGVGGFILMSGAGNEKSQNKAYFEKSTDSGCVNLVFEDADYKNNSTYGFEKQKERLEKLAEELNFDFFLFPNHQDDGNLEIILENCLSKRASEIVACLNVYHECLEKKGLGHKNPKTYHNRWNMIESALLDIKKPEKRDFSDEQIWFIKENPYLAPLINFLDQYFTSEPSLK